MIILYIFVMRFVAYTYIQCICIISFVLVCMCDVYTCEFLIIYLFYIFYIFFISLNCLILTCNPTEFMVAPKRTAARLRDRHQTEEATNRCSYHLLEKKERQCARHLDHLPWSTKIPPRSSQQRIQWSHF